MIFFFIHIELTFSVIASQIVERLLRDTRDCLLELICLLICLCETYEGHNSIMMKGNEI